MSYLKLWKSKCPWKTLHSSHVKKKEKTEIDNFYFIIINLWSFFTRRSGITCNVSPGEGWQHAQAADPAVRDPGGSICEPTGDCPSYLRLQHAVQTDRPPIRPTDVGCPVWGRVQNCTESVGLPNALELVHVYLWLWPGNFPIQLFFIYFSKLLFMQYVTQSLRYCQLIFS